MSVEATNQTTNREAFAFLAELFIIGMTSNGTAVLFESTTLTATVLTGICRTSVRARARGLYRRTTTGFDPVVGSQMEMLASGQYEKAGGTPPANVTKLVN